MRNSVLPQNAVRRCLAICAALALALTVPNVSRAEGFFDLYGGVPFGQSAQVDHQFFGDPAVFPRPAPISATKNLDFSTSWTVGGRAGYWFEALPLLGLAADVSYFERNGSGAEINLVPLSFLVMLRYPLLTSDSFPKGRLQPYVGFGPSLFYSNTSIHFDPPLQNVNDFSIFTGVGFDARAGT